MRIAVVADIHGNLPALESVLADLRNTSPDLVVHGGDVASHGSSPAEVIDLIRELEWPGVRGNTDEMLWNSAQRFHMDNWPTQLLACHTMATRGHHALVDERLSEVTVRRVAYDVRVKWDC